MAHYTSGTGRLPFSLPPRMRGVGQSQFSSDFFDRPTRVRVPAPSRAKPTRKKRRARRPSHGDTIYCVYVGKKKLSCSLSKERAKKIADREKLKRAKRTGVRIKKQKYELRCPPGTRRVCKERKKGSRACRKVGCAKR